MGQISLTRAILIADAVGVERVPDIIRGEAAKQRSSEAAKQQEPKPAPPRKPHLSPAQRLAMVIERARAEQESRRRPGRDAMALGDLFEAA